MVVPYNAGGALVRFYGSCVAAPRAGVFGKPGDDDLDHREFCWWDVNGDAEEESGEEGAMATMVVFNVNMVSSETRDLNTPE